MTGCSPTVAPVPSTVTATPALATLTATLPPVTSEVSATRAAPTPEPTATLLVPTAAAVAPPPTAPPTAAPPAPVGTVTVYEEQITLPTYPFERYQSDVIDPTYNWPYKRFDVERFRTEAPAPEPRTYRLVILENRYLKLLILPELGGRIWQVIHKPSGMPIFYQNLVVKPTHWGLADQLGWLALGGLEWSLPVIEHGYDWGMPWDDQVTQVDPTQATVTLSTPDDGRFIHARIRVTLAADEASFTLEPTLTNRSDHALDFSFWHDAMLAPGSGKRPSADLRFVLPSAAMTLHSTGDSTMPPPGGTFTWPLYQGRDLGRLGNFTQYLGFFEAPAAHGPFVGAYDPAYDTGVVRTFPADIARGSKVFALGWQDALASSNYTDDDSVYVELHGGLAPTFDDRYRLAASAQVSWREQWYPIYGTGGLTYATAEAALAVAPAQDRLAVTLYTPRATTGRLRLVVDGTVTAELAVTAAPDQPFRGTFAVAPQGGYTVELYADGGQRLLAYQAAD